MFYSGIVAATRGTVRSLYYLIIQVDECVTLSVNDANVGSLCQTNTDNIVGNFSVPVSAYDCGLFTADVTVTGTSTETGEQYIIASASAKVDVVCASPTSVPMLLALLLCSMISVLYM